MVGTQLVLTLLLGLVLLLFGKEAAVSGVAGGIAATAGTLLFALKLFGNYRAGEPGQMLGGILGAEFAKLVVMMLIFAAAIRWYEPLNIVAMLIVPSESWRSSALTVPFFSMTSSRIDTEEDMPASTLLKS